MPLSIEALFGRIPKSLPLSSLLLIPFLSLLLVLQACQSTEEVIRQGESHILDLSLQKGQFQAVTIEQTDSDLTIKTLQADSKLSVDYFDGTVGEEKFFFKAKETGTYKVALSLSSKKEGLVGHYKLTLSQPRIPTSEDEDRLEAQRLYAEASQLHEMLDSGDSNFPQQRDLVLKTYEEAIGKWRTAGELALSTLTLLRLGDVRREHREYSLAKAIYQKAMQEAQLSADTRGQADALANIALVSERLSKTWEDKQQTKQLFEQALGLSRQAKDLRVEGSTLSNMGRYFRLTGQYQKALEHYLLSLSKMRALGNREQEGIVLSNIGSAYTSLGLKSEASQAYSDALKIQGEIGNMGEQARCYNGQGRVLYLLGERTTEVKEAARINFEKAVELGKQINDRDVLEHNLGTICYELGAIYREAGDLNKARKLFEEAQVHLQTAFELRKEGNKLQDTLTSIGLLEHERGQKQKARQHLEEALALCRRIKDDYQEAIVNAELARVARDNNQLMGAKTYIEESLRIIESLALRITLPDLRVSYTMAQRRFYDLHADILLRLGKQQLSKQRVAGYYKAAWQQMERARMAAMQESVDSLELLASQGVTQTIVAKLRELRSGIFFVRSLPDSTEKLEQMSKLTTQYQEIETQLAQQNPRAMNQITPSVTSDQLSEIQAALKENMMLLEYALGDDRSYLWVITLNSVEVYPLPGQIQLEDTARQVSEALAEQPPQSQSTIAQPDTELQQTLAKLSHLLLNPIASRLGKNTLLIVADGTLGRIPFGSLPIPNVSPNTSSTYRLLIEDHEITYAPAAITILSRSHRNEPPTTATTSAIAIANPVFDARHSQATYCQQKLSPTAFGQDSSAKQMSEELKPIPFDESDFRRAVFEPLPNAARHEFFGFQAKRGNVILSQLSSYSDIVFYTHGIFNERDQGMTGLALSRLNDQCGVEQHLLNLTDIYSLKLSADLVTLIACNTARDQQVRGFGLGGIARGFMYAGAQNVVGTVWKVAPEASLELIARFYHARRRGNSAPDSLRQAQLSFLNGENLKYDKWRLPYYWAGFVLMGEGN